MAISKNRSNISNNNSKDKLEQKDCNKSLCKCNEDNNKSGSKWLAFWAFTIPAYTYFYGYNAKVYFLNSMGFDVAEMSSDAGEVYHFAFENLLFVTYMSSENALAIFKAAFLSNWHFYLPMTIVVVIGSYLAFKYANKKYGQQSVSEVEYSVKSKKTRKPFPPILASLLSGMAYVLINALAAPIIILLLIFLAIIFLLLQLSEKQWQVTKKKISSVFMSPKSLLTFPLVPRLN
jgi:hypothetical protein